MRATATEAMDMDIRLQPNRRWRSALPLRIRSMLLLATAAVILISVVSSAAAGGGPRKKTTDASFYFIQLSDPQFGLEHSNVEWAAERAMLNRSIHLINALAPRFVVATGDLQNYLPTNTGSGEPGVEQAQQVQEVLMRLDDGIPLRAIVPGNHDIGYAPTVQTLNHYEQRWGADRGTFDEGGVRFVAVDSQLYFNASQPGVQVRADAQTAWLSETLDAAASDHAVAAVVLITHIPPFLNDASEETGWANWPRAVREQVLSMTQGGGEGGQGGPPRLAPSLVINGHVHANVVSERTTAFGAPLEVVTSSSVGCPIRFNGSAARELPPALARAVAAQPTGHELFVNYVLRDGGVGEEDPERVAERVAARPDRSGVRLFEVDRTAGYRHRWYTLEELEQLAAPVGAGSGGGKGMRGSSSSPLADLPFTGWR